MGILTCVDQYCVLTSVLLHQTCGDTHGSLREVLELISGRSPKHEALYDVTLKTLRLGEIVLRLDCSIIYNSIRFAGGGVTERIWQPQFYSTVYATAYMNTLDLLAHLTAREPVAFAGPGAPLQNTLTSGDSECGLS